MTDYQILERFTPRAMRVICHARAEASASDGIVDTEHLLLGLIQERDECAVAGRTLEKLGVKGVWEALAQRVQEGPPDPGRDMLKRFTPPAFRVVRHAKEEARALCCQLVGSEHILLGLFFETDGLAARALERLGVDVGSTREQVKQQLSAAGRVEQAEELTERDRERIQPEQVESRLGPWNAEAHRVLTLAASQACELSPELGLPSFVDIEHLLLAMIAERSNAGCAALQALGLDLDQVHRQVMMLLGLGGTASPNA